MTRNDIINTEFIVFLTYLLTCPDFTCPGEFDDVCPDGVGRKKNGNGVDIEGIRYPNVITVTYEILLFEYFADSELYVFVKILYKILV